MGVVLLGVEIAEGRAVSLGVGSPGGGEVGLVRVRGLACCGTSEVEEEEEEPCERDSQAGRLVVLFPSWVIDPSFGWSLVSEGDTLRSSGLDMT